jgi:tRNA dimethylallyltransferase
MATGDLENDLPLVVIVGPTASGKTSLAIELAKKYDGEIICADSRTIYKGMDIGTAKPTADEQAIVPHWGLDLVEPGESFSVAAFKDYALRKIEEVRERHRIPFLVGGSGLYVDAVLFDYKFSSPSDLARRQELEALSLQELQKYCIENNIILPENSKNKRYVIRAIERRDVLPKRRGKPISKSIIVGIATDREILRQRIRDRAEQIFDDNVVEEATLLGEKYGWDSEAMTGNIYPLIQQYISEEITFEQMKEKFATADWRLAKRQLTWLRRNPYIRWLSLKEAKAYLNQRLAKN